jgi:hypothetical protein
MTGIDHALKKIYPFAAGLLLLLPSAHAQVPEDVKKILLVPSDIGDETVVSRKQAQLDSMDQFDSFLFF